MVYDAQVKSLESPDSGLAHAKRSEEGGLHLTRPAPNATPESSPKAGLPMDLHLACRVK